MTKQEARDIARLLIATSGNNFDGFAFADTDLSEKDIQKVLESIKNICSYEIGRVKKKNGLQYANLSNTKNIVETILYE